MNRKLLIGIGIGVGVLVLLLVVTSFFAPKNTKKKKTKVTAQDITLTYWRPFDDKEVFEPIIKDYEKAHPNVKIEYKKLTAAEYEKTVVDALASGKGPDLFSIHNDWMPKFMNKLSPMPAEAMSVEEYEKTFFPVAATDNVIDKKIYGIPYSIDTLALYLNNQLFNKADINEPPATWTDLVGKTNDPANPTMLEKITNRQGATINQAGIALGNTGVNRSPDVLALLMLQQQTIMTDSNHEKALFNLTQKVEGQNPDPHVGTEALKFYTAFADPKSGFYSWNASMGDSVKAFADGRVVMMLNYAYQIPVLKRLNPNLDYKVVAAPQIGGRDPVNYANYWSEVVAKNSAHPAEAWDFIKFVTDREELRQYTEAAKTVPSRKDASPGNLNAFFAQSPSAVSWYKGDNQKADQIFIDLINQVVKGEDPQRAIDVAANQETEVLKALKGPPQ